jgi:hypothetical protein
LVGYTVATPASKCELVGCAGDGGSHKGGVGEGGGVSDGRNKDGWGGKGGGDGVGSCGVGGVGGNVGSKSSKSAQGQATRCCNMSARGHRPSHIPRAGAVAQGGTCISDEGASDGPDSC